MSRQEYCMPCGEKGNPVFATETADGEPMCRGCAGVAERERKRREEALAAKDAVPAVEMTPEIDFVVTRKPRTYLTLPVVEKPRRVKPKKEPKPCTRGCGELTHRGHCRRMEPTETLSEADKTTLGEVISECRDRWAKDGVETLQLTAPPACKRGDPSCPCQDGDPCHYEGDNPMTPPAVIGMRMEMRIPQQTEEELRAKPPLETVAGLKAQRVTFQDIPALVVFRKPKGRTVELWEQLLACTAEAPVLKLECESIKKAGQLVLHLRARAKKFQKEIDSRRDDNVLYVWLVEMEKSA